MKKTYTGSCHCGAVRYEADIDLATGTGRCNCSICRKNRHWGAMLQPGDFRLLAGSADLGDYQFGNKTSHHEFCRRCGVHTFLRGDLPSGSSYVSVQLATLDDASDAELAGAPVQYCNGRENKWEEAPGETRNL